MTSSMKTYLIVSILSLFNVFFSFASRKAELIIQVYDQRENKLAIYGGDIKIFKDGTHFQTLSSGFVRNDTLRNLELGVYTIVYRTIFDQEEDVEVYVREFKTYTEILYSNYLDYSKEQDEPIINKLKDGESYVIQSQSNSCFGSIATKINISRNKGIYTIQWNEDVKKLTLDDMETIRHFEIELSHFKPESNRFGCTTKEYYTVSYQGESLKYEDRGCNWNGRDYLKRALFGDE